MRAAGRHAALSAGAPGAGRAAARRQRPCTDPQETAGSARQEAGKLPTLHFFFVWLFLRNPTREGLCCARLFFFFSCCAGLFRFSSSFPHVCRFRASGGPVGYGPAPEERSPWDSGAGAPLPRVLSAVGVRRDSGGSGRHRSACGTAVPSGLPVFFPVAAAQQHSSTPLSCTDNFPPRARVTRQRFISLFSPPIPCE